MLAKIRARAPDALTGLCGILPKPNEEGAQSRAWLSEGIGQRHCVSTNLCRLRVGLDENLDDVNDDVTVVIFSLCLLMYAQYSINSSQEFAM